MSHNLPNRHDFPLLVEDPALVYLDSASTTQKPKAVLAALQHYYCHDNANVHRGLYDLSERATAAYEGTREKIKNLINAAHTQEIIFTKGTTESINLVAHSFGRQQLLPGDEMIISAMEHHANIVPWQIVCAERGAHLKIIPVKDDGTLDWVHYRRLFTAKTKLVSLIHVSNVLGTINPMDTAIAIAHEHNVPVVLDGAQAVPHLAVDVQALDCDFYAFSSHKLYGPTGVGVLYGKRQWLQQMPPYQSGGDMIRQVSFEKTQYQDIPYKFEAGTPNIAGVVGLGAAIDYITTLGYDNIRAHDKNLLTYASAQLQCVPGLTIFGQALEKIGVIAFTMQAIHPHDVGTILNSEKIAVRAGHHCAMPLMTRFTVPAMVRASFGVYTTHADIDRLCVGLKKVMAVLG